jgi:hypothetical protein
LHHNLRFHWLRIRLGWEFARHAKKGETRESLRLLEEKLNDIPREKLDEEKHIFRSVR